MIAALLNTAFAAALAAQSPAPDIAVHIETNNHALRARAERAARHAFAEYATWLGPAQSGPLTITLASGRSSAETMDVESLAAYEVARWWWRHRSGDSDVVNGTAWYLQSRAVERLYDLTFLRPGHSADSVRFFGGTITWPLPGLHVSRWHAGLARPAWLHRDQRWPFSGRGLPSSLNRDSLRIAVEVASAERSAGWPVVQAALSASIAAPTSRDLRDAVNEAAGFTMITPGNADRVGDLVIRAITSGPCERSGCYRTRVSVSKDDNFTTGPVLLRVRFADGKDVTATLNGHEAIGEFEFESTSPYVSASLDPEQTILYDRNLLNNTRLAAPVTNVPTAKWVSRWLMWLEDAMLSYSALF